MPNYFETHSEKSIVINQMTYIYKTSLGAFLLLFGTFRLFIKKILYKIIFKEKVLAFLYPIYSKKNPIQ